MWLSLLLLGCVNETPVDESSQALCPAGQICGSCLSCPATVRNGHGICESGFCDVVCNVGFDDCDGSITNGCEVNLNTSNANCGSCGHACAAGTSCQNGTCVVTSCPSGQRLCGATCIPSTGCCTASECGGVTNGDATCYQNQCWFRCSSGSPICQ
jgi:hypothetical protein